MNMTPMIDIVFQLIVFFMLQLKFKDIDQQIDTNLPNQGMAIGLPVEPPPTVEVHAARRGLEPGGTPITRLRIDRSHEILLPDGVTGDAGARAAALGVLADVLRAKAGQGDAAWRGHLLARPPTGGFIPHADAVAVMDAFLVAGITDVTFEGAASGR